MGVGICTEPRDACLHAAVLPSPKYLHQDLSQSSNGGFCFKAAQEAGQTGHFSFPRPVPCCPTKHRLSHAIKPGREGTEEKEDIKLKNREGKRRRSVILKQCHLEEIRTSTKPERHDRRSELERGCRHDPCLLLAPGPSPTSNEPGRPSPDHLPHCRGDRAQGSLEEGTVGCNRRVKPGLEHARGQR